ncbi:hypothetical protein TW86_10540 [Halomonas sp. S2151]|nr:hypothetical protein TW86_10540 [Halomonas sp. S2151]
MSSRSTKRNKILHHSLDDLVSTFALSKSPFDNTQLRRGPVFWVRFRLDHHLCHTASELGMKLGPVIKKTAKAAKVVNGLNIRGALLWEEGNT